MKWDLASSTVLWCVSDVVESASCFWIDDVHLLRSNVEVLYAGLMSLIQA